MTNKVKQFYIRITDDMTPQMVQDAFDKCVDAGVVGFEGVQQAERKHSYTHCYANAFGYFGISTSGGTFFADDESSFHCDAQEITLDHLDEWLGLEVKHEWDGEGLPPVGVECEWVGGGLNHGDWGLVVVRAYNGDCAWIEKLHDKSMHTVRNPAHFLKPETPEQKAERERVEVIKKLTNASELPNGSSKKISAILTMIEDVYGSGALFAVADVLERYDG